MSASGGSDDYVSTKRVCSLCIRENVTTTVQNEGSLVIPDTKQGVCHHARPTISDMKRSLADKEDVHTKGHAKRPRQGVKKS